jgi:hypothetical protein
VNLPVPPLLIFFLPTCPLRSKPSGSTIVITSYTKGHVTRCNFSCDLQCNYTLERCKITKYESSLHSADVFST